MEYTPLFYFHFGLFQTIHFIMMPNLIINLNWHKHKLF